MSRQFRALILPLSIAAFAGMLFGVWKLLDLPPEHRVIEIARDYFNKYGLAVVIVSSFIEGLLIVGLYFPGSMVFFLGLLAAGNDPVQVAQVAGFAIIGIWAAYVVNFYIGRFGWYHLFTAVGLRDSLESAKRKLDRNGISAIAMTFWHPNIGAVVATAAGVLDLPVKVFLPASLLAVAFWLSFWSVVVFWLGPDAISILGFRLLIFLLVVWMAYRFLMARYRPGI